MCTLTCLSLAQCDVRQKVVSGDDAQQLQNVPEVGLVTAPLSLQSQQEVTPVPYSAALELVNDVHGQEGEDAHVAVCEVSADDVEHAVQ